jgi:hypothetical protein
MPKNEALKEKLSNYREIFKTVLFLMVTTLMASVTVSYNILRENLPLNMIFISTIGFVVVLFLIIILKTIWLKMDLIIKELEDA